MPYFYECNHQGNSPPGGKNPYVSLIAVLCVAEAVLLTWRGFDGLTEGRLDTAAVFSLTMCKTIVLFLNREVIGKKKKK